MAVMAAAVHAAFVARLVREVVLLLHRQRVHVRAQSDRLAAGVRLARNDGNQPRLADAGVMLDAQGRKLFLHDARGAFLLEAELGMGVEITTNGSEFVVIGTYGFSWIHVAQSRARRAGAPPSEVFGIQCADAVRSIRNRGSTA